MAPNKKIIYADLDPTEGVVLNLETKNYYRLNETGQVVWQALAAGRNPEEIARSISEAYETTYETALCDVREVVSKMKEESLIDPPPTPSFSVEKAHASKAGK
jgi:hypothetical protein